MLHPNIIICLTQQAYDKYSHILRPGGVLITDSHFVKTSKRLDAQLCELPLYRAITEKLKKAVIFNIGVLGALIAIRPLVKPEAILNVIKNRLPEDLFKINEQALDLGFEMGVQRYR